MKTCRGVFERCLDRTDDVGDPKIAVVDRAGEVVQERPVRPLDDVVLLQSPGELDIASNKITEGTRALAGHLQPHGCGTAFGFEPSSLFVGLGHQAAAVQKAALLTLGYLTLGLDFSRSRVVTIRETHLEQPSHGVAVVIRSLRLVVGRVRPTHTRTFIPINAQPAQVVQDRLERVVDIPLHVGIVDPQDELASVAAARIAS